MKVFKSLLRIACVLLLITIVVAYLFRFEKHEFSSFIADQTGIVLIEPEHMRYFKEQKEKRLKSKEKGLKTIQKAIKDKALYQCLADLGINDVNQIKMIHCPQKAIKSIEGLNIFKFVTEVNLSGNEISQVNLTGMPNLRTLDLSKNEVSHFKAGRTLFLSDVNLSDNQISEFKVERTINYLNLRNNQLTELPELRAKHVNLQENFIESIGMDFSPYIETLDLRRNKIKIISSFNRRSSVIPEIPSYFERIIRKKQVPSHIKIKPLVLLAHNPIDEIDFGPLKTIDIDIAALSPDESVFPDEALRACLEHQPVVRVEELVQLNCSGKVLNEHLTLKKKITSIEGLSNLHAVKSIDLSHNKLKNVNLTGLDNLEKVVLEYNQLETVIWPKIHQINDLNLAHNKLTDMVLDNFDDLQQLDLSNNRLIHFDYPIARLETFNIDNNPIKSNKQLQSDIREHALKLFDSFLAAVPDKALSSCIASHLLSNEQSFHQMTELNCWDYEIDSLQGLEKLTGLKTLMLNNVNEPLFDFSVFSKLNELTLRGARTEQLLLNNPELYKVTILSSEIDVLNLTHNNNLLEIKVSDSQIKIMDLPKNRYTESYYFGHKIDIDETKIGQLNLPSACQFNELSVSNSQLSKLQIPDSCTVEKLTVHRSGLSEFFINEKVQIKSLNLQGNQLERLDISKLQGLAQLQVSDNKLTSITMPLASSEFERLEIAQNPVPLSQIKMQTMPYEILVSKNQYDISFSFKFFFYNLQKHGDFYWLKKDSH